MSTLVEILSFRCWWYLSSREWLENGETAAAAKSFQSCLTLCDPIDGSPPGFPVPGILQARTLEWVATSFSNAWTWKVEVKSLSCVQLLVTPWTAAYQAPPSMGFSRQEYWSGVPLPSLEKGENSRVKWPKHVCFPRNVGKVRKVCFSPHPPHTYTLIENNEQNQ